MTDLDIIKQIEKALNVKLEKLEKIEWDSKGYTINQNKQVIGLILSHCKYKKSVIWRNSKQQIQCFRLYS